MAVKWNIVNTDYTVTGAKGTNQIITLHWTCGDTEKVGDVTHTGHMYGSVGCPDPSGSFIEYAKVTEENCITWAKALLGSDEVTRIETILQAELDRTKSLNTGNGMPWLS